MQRRTLGRTELEIPVVVFGAWALGGTGYWGASDDDLAVSAIREGIENGMDAIDTAPIYGLGHSEEVVGRAIEGFRDDVVIMTKVGLRWDTEDGGELLMESTNPDGSVMRVFKNSRPASVREEVERSLVRLDVDVLDLVQVHWPDATTPIADTMGALAELRAEGKLRAIGVSNYSPEQLAEAQAALGDIPLASDQPKYSLVAREAEAEVLPWCHEHEVGVVVYSPLEQGLLTGKVPPGRTFEEGEGRSHRPTFRDENRRRVNAVLAESVAPIAESMGATLAQTVIAWTVQQPGVTAALVGARTPQQALENAAAGDLALDAAQWAAIDTAFANLELELEPAAG
jgi:aryl-alcohol dehydrogenase-like predicted oxidoreductase